MRDTGRNRRTATGDTGDKVKDARRAGDDTDEVRVRDLRPALVKKGQ